MDQSTPALSSSSSSTPTSISTTAQSVLSLLPHHKSEMDIDDDIFLFLSCYMELEREHVELCRTALAFNSDIMARAQAIHAREIRMANRPCRKRKRKVAASLPPPPPLSMNNSEVIEEALSADDECTTGETM